MKTIQTNYVAPSKVAVPFWELETFSANLKAPASRPGLPSLATNQIQARFCGYVSAKEKANGATPVEVKNLSAKLTDVDIDKALPDQLSALFIKTEKIFLAEGVTAKLV